MKDSLSVDTKNESLVDFVKVTGATITGQVANSNVFIEGRTIKINDFYICDHEVTQSEYEECWTYGYSSTNRLCGPRSHYGVGANYPAYNVSWYDTLVYCNKRSIKEGFAPCYIIAGSRNPDSWGDVPREANDKTWDSVECDFSANGYRLPTEAEWEYAARGGNGLIGKQTKFAGSNTIGDVAWYMANSCTWDGNGKAHEVKGLKPNSLGLYDMSGNVEEWCWDWDGDIKIDTANTGANYGIYRIIRGGSWSLNSPIYATVSCREYYNPFGWYSSLGFRVVRSSLSN